MRKVLKMVLCSALLVAAMFSFSAFTSAPSAHAATLGMNPHTTPDGATAHTTPDGFTGHIVSDTTMVTAATSCPPTISEWSPQTSTVERLQNDLNWDYYDGYFENYPYNFHPYLAVDGSFGPDTYNAVRDFQYYYNLKTDGIVGPLTWHALGAC